MLDEKIKVFSLRVLVVGELLLVTSEGTLFELSPGERYFVGYIVGIVCGV